VRITPTKGTTFEPPVTKMHLVDALAVVRAMRGSRDVVITTMAPARDWMAMSKSSLHPLDLVLVPSAMGQATSMGLGIALAQPDRRVIVCNGDGSMLMNLGSLVSIVAAAPPNLTVLVFDNGVYEVTGAQITPGTVAGVDYTAMARACGFKSVYRFSDLGPWSEAAARVLVAAGPTFVLLDIEPTPGVPGPRSPGPAGERSKKFIEALRV
jgi:phosphonopyruvate decarboxylase